MSEPVNGLAGSVSQRSGVSVLSVRGEVDLVTGRDFSAQLDEALPSGGDLLVVDMAGVDFLGSAGLAALIRFQETAEQRGVRLRLVCGPAARRTIELTGLAQRFTLADNVTAALDTAAGKP